METYLDNAKMLRPELEDIDGFVDNIRYASLTRDGWLLSLSSWRDEKAVVRWRTRMRHHLVQAKGRSEILSDYHLRVGEVVTDNQIPAGHVLKAQRLDETEVGDGTTAVLVDGGRTADWVKARRPEEIAASLGLEQEAADLVAWDVFEAVLTPGDVILFLVWRTRAAAEAFEHRTEVPEGSRRRRVRIVRDYGMFDRREAPQYFPDVPRRTEEARPVDRAS